MSGVAPRVRPFEPRDVPALTRLSGELGYASTEGQLGARLARVLADKEHAVFVAEDAAGRVAGWAHVFINKLVESDPRAEIGGLVTEPGVRRQGIGRALMQHAEQWAKENALPAVSLRTNIKRAEAQKFYESLGYTIAKTQFNYRKQL